MNANETRVSQAVRSVEGGADSHEDLYPPEAAGEVEVSCAVNEHVTQCAMAPVEQTPAPPPLTEAQLSAFWAGIVANLDAARRVAARFVSRQSVEDVVNTVALLFVKNAQRSKKPERFPASAERFRRKFLQMVRNHALDCVREGKRPACSVHSLWGIDPEPGIAGRNVADRELDTVFARNDQGKYDAPAPTVRRDKDDLDGLHHILRNHMKDLSQTQREIIHEAYFEGQSPDEIAARRGISLNTYHNHRKAAFSKLRDSMMAVVDVSTDLDLPDWYDRVEEMSKRHAAGQRRRASSKKVNRFSAGGDRSNVEGDRSNVEDDPSNARGDAEKDSRATDDSVAVATES